MISVFFSFEIAMCFSFLLFELNSILLFLLFPHYELGFVVDSTEVELEDDDLEGLDLLASSALLDFDSSADLSAAAFDSLSDFDAESEAALLAAVASNCRTVSTIFV